MPRPKVAVLFLGGRQTSIFLAVWALGLSSLHTSSVTEQILAQDRSCDTGPWSREEVQLRYHSNTSETLTSLGIENILDEQRPFLGSVLNDNVDVRSHDISGRFLYERLGRRL